MSKVMLIAARAQTIPVLPHCDYIGIDCGAYTAMQQSIPLVCAVGDFDSVTAQEKEELSSYTKLHSMPSRKDDTDSEAALRYAITCGYDEIILYGCFGGRVDHTMANIYLLLYRNVNLTLMDEHNTIKLLRQGVYRVPNTHKYLSFLALEKTMISEKGVAYPLDHKWLTPDVILAVSNEIINAEAVITIHTGSVLMMQCDEQ